MMDISAGNMNGKELNLMPLLVLFWLDFHIASIHRDLGAIGSGTVRIIVVIEFVI